MRESAQSLIARDPCYCSGMRNNPTFGLCYPCLVLLVLAVPGAKPQTPPTDAAMPSDPKELMLLAAKSNNLTGRDSQPWHLKAIFTVVDDQGKTTDQGTYEEFWAGPTKNKTIVAGPGYSRTDVHTAAGLFRSGTGGFGPTIAAEAQREFVEPLPIPSMIEHEGFDLEKKQVGNSNLACLKITGLQANPRLEYCLADDKPLLRVSVIGFESLQIIHDRILSFRGHYIAGDLQFFRAGKMIGTAHLDSIVALDPVNEADFQPPPGVKLVPLKIGISSTVAGGMLKEHPTPEYPPQAITAGIQGAVILGIVIGTDGHVSDVHVVSGPAILQQPAMDAVRKWVYRPYLLNGQPVGVNTTAYVVFSLENHVPTVKP
jgi:TonB family protein